MDNREGFQAQGWNHATTGDQPRQSTPRASGLGPMPPLRPMPSPGIQPPAPPSQTYPTPAAGAYNPNRTPEPQPAQPGVPAGYPVNDPQIAPAPQQPPMYPTPAMGAARPTREPAAAFAQPAQLGVQAGYPVNDPQTAPAPQQPPMYPTPVMGAARPNREPAAAFAQPGVPAGYPVYDPQTAPAPQQPPMYPTPAMGAARPNREPAAAFAQPAQPGVPAGYPVNDPQTAPASQQPPMYPTPAMGAARPNREPAAAFAQPGVPAGYPVNDPQTASALQQPPMYPTPAMGGFTANATSAVPSEAQPDADWGANTARTERHIWTQTVAQPPAQTLRPLRDRATETVPRAAFVPDAGRPQPQANADTAAGTARRRRAERLDGAGETPELDEQRPSDPDAPQTRQPAFVGGERAKPSPAQTGAETPAAWPPEPAVELLDDDSGRFEPVSDVPLAEPVPVPTREAYRAKGRRGKRRVWPALLGTVAALAAIVSALLFTGLGNQLLSAVQPSRVGQAGVPSVFAQHTPQGGVAESQTQALATIAPAQLTTAAELVSVTVDPASATAPTTLTFTLETNSETSSIRLLTATGDVVRAVAYGTPKRDGLSWRLEATVDTPYTGKIRVFLRNQAGVWTEAEQTCDVAVQ